jgi:hypothetical protein
MYRRRTLAFLREADEGLAVNESLIYGGFTYAYYLLANYSHPIAITDGACAIHCTERAVRVH